LSGKETSRMARPHCCRRIGFLPEVRYFKPVGVRLRGLEEVILTLDELEALRLADLEGCYQEEAAGRMGISRPTFSRIVENARRKVADALVNGKALRMEGGSVTTKGEEPMRGRMRRGPARGGRGATGGQGMGRREGDGMQRGMGRGPCGAGDRNRFGRSGTDSGTRRGPGREGIGQDQPSAGAGENRQSKENGDSNG